MGITSTAIPPTTSTVAVTIFSARFKTVASYNKTVMMTTYTPTNPALVTPTFTCSVGTPAAANSVTVVVG